MCTKYVASTSARVDADRLISENTTGRVNQAAAYRTLSQHLAPSAGPVSVSQVLRPSNGFPYRVGWDTFDSAEGKAPVQKLLPGETGFLFLNTGVHGIRGSRAQAHFRK